MAMVYIILAIVVLAVNWQVVPAVLRQMLRGAVGVNEVGGALTGSAWGETHRFRIQVSGFKIQANGARVPSLPPLPKSRIPSNKALCRPSRSI